MNESITQWYIYKVHNLRYSYVLYNKCKNTKFKIKIVLHIKRVLYIKSSFEQKGL